MIYTLAAMDDATTLFFSSALFLLPSLTLFFFFFFLFSRRNCRRCPPGSTGFPLIGETLQLIAAYKTDNPEPFIDSRVARYGPIFTTHVFGERTVFSTDPEANQYILQNEGRLFEASYPGSISNLLGKHSLVLMKGNLHKRMHSLTMSFANSPILRDHLLLDIDRLVRLRLDSWTATGRVLLMEEAKQITFELTMKQLLSYDPCEWTERLRKEYMLVIEGFFSIPIPIIFSTYRRAIQARGKVGEALTPVVRERRRELMMNGGGGGGGGKKDMLAALFEEEGNGGGGGGFSDEEIVDFMMALLVAGYETTSTIMTLAVKFLTETPLALEHLKEEHEEIKARKNGGGDSGSEALALDWDDYKSMPFTQSVVNETLRIANIIGGVFRRTIADVNVGGYTIPKGRKVFASFRAVHLDHENFKDARTFNPWRWQNMNISGEINLGNKYAPFGGGPRRCPGAELGRAAISVFLHHLVTRFSWVAAEEDKLVFFPTTRTQKRYPIIVQRL